MKQLVSTAVAIAAVLAIAACGKKKDEGGGGGGGGEAACAAAIGKAVQALPAGGAPGAGEVQTRLGAALTKRCTEDKWPADVIRCYEAATNMQTMTACRQKLPPELAQKTLDDIRGAMMGGMGGAGGMGGPGGMRSPHGGAPSGVQIPDGVKVPVSDTAGAGSAAAGGSADAAGSAAGSAAPAK